MSNFVLPQKITEKETYERKEIISNVFKLIWKDDDENIKFIFNKNKWLKDDLVSFLDNGMVESCARNKHVKVCKLLIELGFNLNVTSRYVGYLTPLDHAATDGCLEIIKLLLDNGAWINGDSRGISTPLISASQKGHFEIVEYLLKFSPDLNRLQSNYNRTALDMAIGWGHPKIAELLKAHGALSAYVDIDLDQERAPGIISHISSSVGYPMNCKFTQHDVDLRISLIEKGNKFKLLFTIGMHVVLPRKEIMMCVPHNFPINQQLMLEKSEYSFPMNLLSLVAKYRLDGHDLPEGLVIEKTDERWSVLKWPINVDAFILVNYLFNQTPDEVTEPDENEDVTLLLLCPILYPKTGCPKGKKLEEWIEKKRKSKWPKVAWKGIER